MELYKGFEIKKGVGGKGHEILLNGALIVWVNCSMRGARKEVDVILRSAHHAK